MHTRLAHYESMTCFRWHPAAWLSRKFSKISRNWRQKIFWRCRPLPPIVSTKSIHWRCNEAVAGRESVSFDSCRFSSTTTLIVLRWFCWGWNRHPISLCGKPTDFRMRPIVLVSIPGEPLNYSSRQGPQGIPLLRDITCCAASPWRKQGPVR